MMTHAPRPSSEAPVTIVVTGGGTAGWMTAAALSRFLQRGYRIRLVESDAIGTVGVGEATIPQIVNFNTALGIDEDAFLKATQGTFKLGIEFVDWLRPGHRYMHAFGDVGRAIEGNPFIPYWLRAQELGVAKPLSAYSLNEMAARAERMHRGGPVTSPMVPAIPYAFHFDAGLYAAFLRRIAEEQGVERIEGRIVSVERDGTSGDVAALLLEGDRRVEGDLFVDCTGFRALLIGETLGVGFEDWGHWLPCDRALAVPSDIDDSLTPYTRSTAKAAGWQWRIPLQHRIGNGLVYSSAHLSDDEAAATLLAGLDTEALADPRPIRFRTGRRREGWRGNVVAIGLASGFLEPLESTSIHMIQSAIQRLLKLIPRARATDAIRAEYNRQTDFEIERIRDVIILHYHANQRDEPLWQAVRAMTLPDSLRHKLDLWRASGAITREHEELFTEVGWFQVLVGQGVISASYHPIADQINAADLGEFMELVEALYRREALALTDHAAFVARHCAGAAA
nr:tryptophan halogenase family protein [Sphingomonas jinjuensis]